MCPIIDGTKKRAAAAIILLGCAAAWLDNHALAAPRQAGAVADQADIVEVNDYWDEWANTRIFRQVIAWDFCWHHTTYIVTDWRIIRRPWLVQRTPDGYSVRFWDHKDQVPRILHCTIYRKTITQVDPELLNRLIVPEADRRRFRRPKCSSRNHCLTPAATQ